MTLKEIWKQIVETLSSNKTTAWTCDDFDIRPLIERIIEILKDKHGGIGDIPKDKVDSIAETLLPDIVAFFQTEEGQRVFAEWKKEQEEKRKKEGGET